jgi:hypothetical protein
MSDRGPPARLSSRKETQAMVPTDLAGLVLTVMGLFACVALPTRGTRTAERKPAAR